MHGGTPLRLSAALAMLFLGLTAFSRANASPFPYTVTDLGTTTANSTSFEGKSWHVGLTTDANGDITGVSNADGTIKYAFDKSPVWTSYGGPAAYSPPLFQEGYAYNTIYHTISGNFTSMITVSGALNLQVQQGPFWGGGPNPPVTDVNIHGQMIGDLTGNLAILANPPAGLVFTYGVVPPNGGFAFRFEATGALIDDSGRVLAPGTNGHEYLLTPTSLGTPQTVPEPSTLIVFGLVAAAIVRRGCPRSRT